MTGPGTSYRRGISLLEITRRFDTVEKAETWFMAATVGFMRQIEVRP